MKPFNHSCVLMIVNEFLNFDYGLIRDKRVICVRRMPSFLFKIISDEFRKLTNEVLRGQVAEKSKKP